MTNANGSLVTRPGQQISTETSADPFSAYAETQTNRFIVGKLLKFTKGDYSAGDKGEPIPLGTCFAVLMQSLIVGWVKWKDNRPVEHVMGTVLAGYVPPRRSDLGDEDPDHWDLDPDGQPRDPWQRGAYFLCKIDETAGISDERFASDDPLAGIYTFAASSVGGMDAITALCKAYGPKWRENKNCAPVIKLGMESYQHKNKSYGRIKKPVFEIVEYTDRSVFPPIGPEDEAEEPPRQVAQQVTQQVAQKPQQQTPLPRPAPAPRPAPTPPPSAVAAAAAPAAKPMSKPRF